MDNHESTIESLIKHSYYRGYRKGYRKGFKKATLRLGKNVQPILQEEEKWAYNNQIDAIKNNNEKEITWNRGYRSALKTIGDRLVAKMINSRKKEGEDEG